MKERVHQVSKALNRGVSPLAHAGQSSTYVAWVLSIQYALSSGHTASSRPSWWFLVLPVRVSRSKVYLVWVKYLFHHVKGKLLSNQQCHIRYFFHHERRVSSSVFMVREDYRIYYFRVAFPLLKVKKQQMGRTRPGHTYKVKAYSQNEKKHEKDFVPTPLVHPLQTSLSTLLRE